MDTGMFRQESHKLFSLLLPILLSGLSQIYMVFIDTMMMGRLGVDALASGSLGFAVYVIVYLVNGSLISAVGIILAREIDEPVSLLNTLYHGFILVHILAFVSMSILWQAPRILLAIGQDPVVVEGASAYLQALLWAVLPASISLLIREFCSALQSLRFIAIINLLAIPLNAFANYVLMYGKYGFPVLGLAGIGWATTLVSVFVLISLIAFVLFATPFSRYCSMAGFPSLSLLSLRKIIKLGFPVAVRSGVEIGLFTTVTILMGLLGKTQLAAYHISIQTVEVVSMVPLAIARALSLRVSINIGKSSVIAAIYSSYAGLLYGVVFAIFVALVFVTSPFSIFSVYLDVHDQSNHEVLRVATGFLEVASLFLLVDAIQIITNGALYGLKDTLVPMFLGFLSYWGVGLFSGYLLAFKSNFGGIGLWWGLALGLASAAIIFSWRLYHGFREMTNGRVIMNEA
jgi:MATE family multidrug resistance protein